ncbi:MAG: sulfatase-like hydrolase/transferase [Planctomycetota bacterium]|jgi:arylsulfatase A-like enzyme
MRYAPFQSVLALMGALVIAHAIAPSAAAAPKPNIVFIIVDDMNDLPLRPAGKPRALTPHMDRLAARGVSFTNAHTNDPLCAPSRAAMLFSLYPQTTGLYWFENWRSNPILNSSVSLPQHLANHGYGVYATGKIFHSNQRDASFHEFGHRQDFGPFPWDGQSKVALLPHPAMNYMYEGDDEDMPYKWEHHFGPLTNVPDWPADPANNIPGYKGWRHYNKPWNPGDANNRGRDPMADELSAGWAAEVIGREHDQPFAVFAGLIRTHTPLYAPQEYFDRFPLDEIQLPDVLPGDTLDGAGPLVDKRLYGFRRYDMLFREPQRDLYRKWVQAYLACLAFVDDQVGKIVDAVDRSPHKNNTIILLTSDHGFHVGEKEFLYKGSLWEGGTRVPLIIAGDPAVPAASRGAVCNKPVTLLDLYPTLIDLAGLPKEPNLVEGGNNYALEGHSMKPFLQDPINGVWTGPAVAITAIPGKNHMQHTVYDGTYYPHFSVRSERWRYTLCANGEEELYDHEIDPLEKINLANDPNHATTKAHLKEQLIALRDGDRWVAYDRPSQWRQPGGAVHEADGSIQSTVGQPTYLATKAIYRDFEAEFDMKTPANAPAQIVYRAKIEARKLTGRVFTIPDGPIEGGFNTVTFQTGGWNRYRVRMLNKRHQVWINNLLVIDELVEEASSSGPIGLNVPGDTEPTLIKNVRVRPLRRN